MNMVSNYSLQHFACLSCTYYGKSLTGGMYCYVVFLDISSIKKYNNLWRRKEARRKMLELLLQPTLFSRISLKTS